MLSACQSWVQAVIAKAEILDVVKGVSEGKGRAPPSDLDDCDEE